MLRVSSGLLSPSTRTPTKRKRTPAAAHQGDGTPQSLPYAVKEKIRSLGLAEEDSDLLTECLEEAKCVKEIQALVHSSEAAMKVLRKRGCTDDALADQVAKVHADLHTTLTACAEKGIGKGLLELFFGTCQAVALVDMEAMYQASRPTLVLFVGDFMEAVHGAAMAALQTLERDVATPSAV
ncbi:hypothetical protein COCOBI_01-4550 [Coccomyxa sp. Obi]|nr:hypothetical protein COCOBI_01-4550 [Coccomyxa sp. Obi]